MVISLLPKFSSKNIPVVLASSNEYVPYLSVCLISLKKNSSPYYNYDITILETDISENNKKILKLLVEEKNICLRFYNPQHYFTGLNLYVHAHFSIQSYYRLAIGEIFKNYNKVIYLDIDTVILRDISELYKINLDKHPLAATKDIYFNAISNKNEKQKEYLHNYLKISDNLKYHNTGILLINPKEYQKRQQELLNAVSSHKFSLIDQDAINFIFFDKIKKLSFEWNCITFQQNDEDGKLLSDANKELLNQYMKARENPCIVHYSGTKKPWNDTTMDFSEFWWKYAILSPYLGAMISNVIKQEITSITYMINYKKNRNYYFLFKFIHGITLGKLRKKYKNKYKQVKDKMRKAKLFLEKYSQ